MHTVIHPYHVVETGHAIFADGKELVYAKCLLCTRNVGVCYEWAMLRRPLVQDEIAQIQAGLVEQLREADCVRNVEHTQAERTPTTFEVDPTETKRVEQVMDAKLEKYAEDKWTVKKAEGGLPPAKLEDVM